MKYSIVMLLLISFFGSVSAAPGGGHHKTAIYDYHDFVNSNIQSKTFSRYHAGMVYDEVWSFDRTSPGEVVRTEIATDSFGAVTRCVVNVFQATPESYNWTQNSRDYPPDSPRQSLFYAILPDHTQTSTEDQGNNAPLSFRSLQRNLYRSPNH